MKRICVLLLAAILLIPSFLGIIPASEAATPEKKPFQMINFNSPGEIEGVDNIYSLPHFWTPQGDPGGKITVQAYSTYNIKEIALKMREAILLVLSTKSLAYKRTKNKILRDYNNTSPR